MSLEVEVKLEDAPIEASLESMTLRHFPLLVDNGECDVFIGDACAKTNSQSVGGRVWLQIELWSFSLIGKVRIEDVELVTLHNLGRWIFRVVMRLIVLVPLIALLDTVEKSRLPHDKQLLLTLDEHVLVGSLCVFSVNKVSKLLLIRIHALFLCVLEHLHRSIVEAIVIHNIESNSCVKSRLFDFLGQTELHVSFSQAI